MWTDRYANGEWITPTYIVVAAGAGIVISFIGVMVLIVTSHSGVDAFNRPLGTDFSSFWTAGKLVLSGHASDVYNWPIHHALQKQIFGEKTPYFSFAYPPPFLLVALPLAKLPYALALVTWQVGTLAPLAWLITRIVPHKLTLLAVLGCPVILVNALHGQNAFLTAGLIGGGLFVLDRRPWLAGMLFGCLIYKPQLGLVIPLLLLAGRHWRALAGACLAASLLLLLSVAVFGLSTWLAFFNSIPFVSHIMLDEGGPGFEKMQSVYAVVRLWGADRQLAYVAQILIAVAALATMVYLAWRRAGNARNAAVCAAVFLTTPFVLDYDLVVVEVGAAFLVARGLHLGFTLWEKTAIGLLWIAPGLARLATMGAAIPFSLIAAMSLLIMAVHRGTVVSANSIADR